MPRRFAYLTVWDAFRRLKCRPLQRIERRKHEAKKCSIIQIIVNRERERERATLSLESMFILVSIYAAAISTSLNTSQIMCWNQSFFARQTLKVQFIRRAGRGRSEMNRVRARNKDISPNQMKLFVFWPFFRSLCLAISHILYHT